LDLKIFNLLKLRYHIFSFKLTQFKRFCIFFYYVSLRYKLE